MSTANGQILPERVRQARQRAGLSLAAVTERLAHEGHPLTRAALSKYELGKSTPRQSTVLALARVLSVAPSYFLTQSHVRIQWLPFRKGASLTRARQERVRAEAADVVANQVLLEEILAPNARLRFPRAQRATDEPDAERAADAVRRHWHLGAAVLESVVRTIEDHGGIVWSPRDSVPDFDGLSGWANGKYPILVSRGDASLDRVRYNFARELGHIAMDTASVPEERQERLAHRFAAAFLVPAEVARRELGRRRRSITLAELALLKEKYGLSMQGWARRARDLGIIAEGTFKGLCVAFGRRGWRKSEPVAFTGNEEPMRLRLLTLRALAEGIITPSRAEEICPGCAARLGESKRRVRASQLRRLTVAQRERALREGADATAGEYSAGGTPLREFEAFGDSDLLDDES